MQLTFLGNRYTRTETTINGVETQHSGIFLGNRYTMTQVHAPQHRANLQLKYRGQSYTR